MSAASFRYMFRATRCKRQFGRGVERTVDTLNACLCWYQKDKLRALATHLSSASPRQATRLHLRSGNCVFDENMILIGKYNCLVSFAFRCYAISDNSVDSAHGCVYFVQFLRIQGLWNTPSALCSSVRLVFSIINEC